MSVRELDRLHLQSSFTGRRVEAQGRRDGGCAEREETGGSRQTDRKIERQTDRETDRQTERKRHRETERVEDKTQSLP